MNFILGLAMDIFGIIVGLKIISLGFHWIKSIHRETKETGDSYIAAIGRKIRKRNEERDELDELQDELDNFIQESSELEE